MADQLTGRALSEAAAIAMGWTIEGEGRSRSYYSSDGKWLGGVESSRCHECGQADDGAPRVAEMLAWLHQLGGIVELLSGPLEATVRIVGKGQHPMRGVTGTTLDEALARLVVEVARARGQQ